MDTIIIEELEVAFRVGVSDTERAQPQRLLITIELILDLTLALEKDDLRWTIDYAAVCERVKRLGENRNWRLIETLAAEIVEVLLREFGATTITVEVKKFILPQTRYVAARVTRSAEIKPVETRFLTRTL